MRRRVDQPKQTYGKQPIVKETPSPPKSCDKLAIIADLHWILEGKSVPINYVTTKTGIKLVEYKNHNFEKYFTSTSIVVWRCVDYETTKCTSLIVSKDKQIYEYEVNHNHTTLAIHKDLSDVVHTEYNRPVLAADLPWILEGPSVPIKLIPTRIGGMKVEYKDHHFGHHFSRKGVAFYRCVNFERTKCQAAIVSKDKKIYAYEARHNHTENAICDNVIKPITTMKSVDKSKSNEKTEKKANYKVNTKQEAPKSSKQSTQTSPQEHPKMSELKGNDFKTLVKQRLAKAMKNKQ